jgi:hypothetical protein
MSEILLAIYKFRDVSIEVNKIEGKDRRNEMTPNREIILPLHELLL